MKLEKGTELAMLQLVVKPQIQKARECLRAKDYETMYKIILNDVVDLLNGYQKSETEKYENAPDNLKTAPHMEKMQVYAELYGKALNLLWDENERTLRPVDEETLDKVEGLIDEILSY